MQQIIGLIALKITKMKNAIFLASSFIELFLPVIVFWIITEIFQYLNVKIALAVFPNDIESASKLSAVIGSASF
jgi:hypothetical protein